MDNSMLLLVCLVLVFPAHRLCCDKLVMYTFVKFLESATMFFNKPHTIFKLLLIPSLNIFLLDSVS